MKVESKWEKFRNSMTPWTMSGRLLPAILLIIVSCASGTGSNSGAVVPPTVLKREQPIIPVELRQVRGVVEVSGTIPKEGGHMRDIRIVRSEDSRLNPIVLDAISKWVWQAGTLNGNAVDTEFRVQIKFPSD